MKYLRWSLIGLAALLLILLVFLFVQYESLRQAQIIGSREFLRSQLLERHAPLAPSDAGVIRSWMTFEYINKIFALPPNYLLSQLKISDSHYPRLTIAEYAGNIGVNQVTVLGEVESAIQNYAAPLTAPTSTTSTQAGSSKST